MNTALLHVLIAEDEAAHVEAIRRAFETAGTRVDLRAVATLREYRACSAEWTPDLALVDLNLPDGRAVEVLTHPPEDAAFPVLVMTAFGNQEIVVEVMKAGALDYVVKSLEAFAAMPSTVERAFREWRLLQEHKQTDAALVASEKKYRNLVDTTGTGFLILDVQGRVLDANQEYVRLAGYKQLGDILGRRVTEWTAAPAQQRNMEAVVQCIQDGKIRDFVVEYVDEKGKITTVEINATIAGEGEALRIVSLCRDVTKRCQSEAEMQQKTAVLEAQTDASVDGILIVDEKGNKILQNQRCVELWKLPKHIIDNPDDQQQLEFVKHRTRDPEKFIERVLYLYAHPNETSNDEVEFNDGTILDRYSAPIIGKEGKRYGRIWLFRDITEHKLGIENLKKSNEELATALQQLKKAQEQLVREERLSALGQMASGIAHDFNNMLMPIVGYSDMLLSQPELRGTPDELAMIKDINTAAQDAKQIVHRMRLIRDAAAEGEYEVINVNKIVSSALALTRLRWEKEMEAKGVSISMVKRLDANKPVLGNESQLREALMNLVLNAVESMPYGGTLTISSIVENSTVLLDISDTGVGMPDDVKQRCGEPFFTTKGVKGTGLGLSVVHGIVRGHGGTVSIESEIGRGTTIHLRFPCASPKPAPEWSIKEKAEGDFIIAAIRILVADDDTNSRALVVRILKKDGHSVETAGTGMEAINKAQADIFDLVITDRAMPEGNGDSVALSVKTRTPETPVILLTGFGDIMKDDGECPAGIDKILCKPVTREDLRRAIEEVMGKSGLKKG